MDDITVWIWDISPWRYCVFLLRKTTSTRGTYAYFHGHTVGGTNPSLIEALGSTDLNLLVDVGFNKEVAEDCALYWSRKPGSLAKLIDKADQMSVEEIAEMGRRAKKRVAEEYTWDKICGLYEKVWTGR